MSDKAKQLTYAELLRKDDIDPDKSHTITLAVTELQFNALEDLLFAQQPHPEVETICRVLWIRISQAIVKYAHGVKRPRNVGDVSAMLVGEVAKEAA